jgi:hypothetical protein
MYPTTKIAAGLFASLLALATPQAATFDYRGNLQDGGKPAEGQYDLELTLYSAASGGSAIGGPLTLYAVPVHGGSFSTEADFGPVTSVRGDAWLAVKVRPAGSGTFSPLSARAAVSASTAASTSVCPGAWTLFGNAGNPTGSYLGTADTQPLMFEVNAKQVGLITPSGDTTNNPDAPNVVFGASGNLVSTGTNAVGATVSGGGSTSLACGASNNMPCINSATGSFSTVAGGNFNTANQRDDTVSGGAVNTASGGESTVSGGSRNVASQQYASVSGGFLNTASGLYAAVSGGVSNTASGVTSVAAGGQGNQAGGDDSFAAGFSAVVRDKTAAANATGDNGTFVWADDSSSSAFTSSGPHQFLIRAAGGVGINTTAPKTALHVQNGGGTGFLITPVAGTLATLESDGNAFLSLVTPSTSKGGILFRNPGTLGGGAIVYDTSGSMQFNTLDATRMTLAGGQLGIGVFPTPGDGHLIDTSANSAFLSTGGTWTNGSSRTFKEAFAGVDVGDVLGKVLALPVQTWFYRNSHVEGRHMGPMAEDFANAFGLGADDQHIGTVDEGGVAFAAIQGLNAKVDNADKSTTNQITVLKRENDELRATLGELSSRLAKLESSKGQ